MTTAENSPQFVKELPKKRVYQSLDMWRGILAIWVVVFHFLVSPDLNPVSIIPHQFLMEVTKWGPLRVPMFFVISGYCMAAAAANLIDRNQSVGRFALARVRRIYPPHVILTLFGVFLLATAWSAQYLGLMRPGVLAGQFEELTLQAIVTNLLLIHTPLNQPIFNAVTWTLCYEVAFYAIMAVAILMWRKMGWEVMLKALHVVTVLAFAVSIYHPSWAIFPFNTVASVDPKSPDMMVNAWTSFGEGVLLFDLLCGKRWADRGVRERYFYWTMGFLLTGLMTVQVVYSNVDYSYNILVTSLFAIVLYLLHPLDAKITQLKSVKWLFVVGGFSYSLYLTHQVVLLSWHRFLSASHVRMPSIEIDILVTLGVCIACSYAFYHLAEKPFISSKSKKTFGIYGEPSGKLSFKFSRGSQDVSPTQNSIATREPSATKELIATDRNL